MSDGGNIEIADLLQSEEVTIAASSSLGMSGAELGETQAVNIPPELGELQGAMLQAAAVIETEAGNLGFETARTGGIDAEVADVSINQSISASTTAAITPAGEDNGPGRN